MAGRLGPSILQNCWRSGRRLLILTIMLRSRFLSGETNGNVLMGHMSLGFNNPSCSPWRPWPLASLNRTPLPDWCTFKKPESDCTHKRTIDMEANNFNCWEITEDVICRLHLRCLITSTTKHVDARIMSPLSRLCVWICVLATFYTILKYIFVNRPLILLT